MPVPPTSPHDSHSIMVAVLFIAALCVMYWRMAIRLLAIILIVLLVCGVIAGLHGMHHTVG